MCTRCLSDALADAEGLLKRTGPVYWRELTDVERESGDVERMREEMDNAEERVIKSAREPLRKVIAQLVDEANALLESGELGAIGTLKPSYVSELAAALKKATSDNIASGKKQVLDLAQSKGVKLASLPPRKDPKKAADYAMAKADAMAAQIAEQMASVVRRQAIDAAMEDLDSFDDEALEAIDARTARELVASAYEVGRESFSIGRVYGYDEIRDSVESVVYTAVLDDSVCEVCLDADGTVYDDPDEGFSAAPNDGCLGGSKCRCFPVIVFKR